MSWSFDEVNDYATVADATRLSLPDADWSMGGWVNLDDNTGTAFQYIVSWGGFDASPSFNLYVGEATVGTPLDRNQLILVMRDSGGDGIRPLGTAPDLYTTFWAGSSAWRHIVISRSSNTIYMFVDGSQVDSQAVTNFNGVDLATSLYFGSRSDLNADRHLGGQMYDWFKVNRALSALEITALQRQAAWRVVPELRVATSTAWYLPMRHGGTTGRYDEIVGQTAVTNSGSTNGATNPPLALRQRLTSFLDVAAAPSGISIPIAAYHYAHHLGSMS